MRPLTAVVALLAAAALSACSSISVSTDWDRSADLTSLRTFAWMPYAPDAPHPFAGNTIVEKRVTEAVERDLGAKGIRRDDRSPSFRIAMHTLTRDVLNVTTWPSWGYGWHGHPTGAWGDQVEVNQYTEGTLVLDFVDPASQNLLWRGVARSAIDGSTGSPEFVDEVIGKLLAEFPPAAEPK
jgi:uncharacterized protein DUF4136